jgi:hypothetical protein
MLTVYTCLNVSIQLCLQLHCNYNVHWKQMTHGNLEAVHYMTCVTFMIKIFVYVTKEIVPHVICQRR